MNILFNNNCFSNLGIVWIKKKYISVESDPVTVMLKKTKEKIIYIRSRGVVIYITQAI